MCLLFSVFTVRIIVENIIRIFSILMEVHKNGLPDY